jgi:hypothetical protein
MDTQELLKTAGQSAFVHHALHTLDSTEYRRVVHAEDLDDVLALRRAAYLRHEVYARDDQPMTDRFDLDPRCFTFGVHVNGVLAASIRIHIVNSSNCDSNSVQFFGDALKPLIDQGLSFMDPTRFACSKAISQEHPGLPLATLRLGFMAAKHFGADFCLSMIREEHELFYRRVFRSTQIAPYAHFPVFKPRYALFSSPKSMEEPICQRFPIFRSTRTERALLFDEAKPGQPRVLGVRPTARIAMRQHEALARGQQNGLLAAAE